MEERNEVVGLKVKDVRTIKEEPETTTETEGYTIADPEEKVIARTDVDITENVEEPVVNEEPEVVEPEPEVVVPDEVLDNEPKVPESDGFKRTACARLFNAAGTTVYRFDIFYKEYKTNDGTIEYRNIIDNFNAVRPQKVNELKEFFAMFGIIRWNFPTTVVPVNTNVLEALLKIECLINEQIKSAGIKKNHYQFRVDTGIDE